MYGAIESGLTGDDGFATMVTKLKEAGGLALPTYSDPVNYNSAADQAVLSAMVTTITNLGYSTDVAKSAVAKAAGDIWYKDTDIIAALGTYTMVTTIAKTTILPQDLTISANLTFNELINQVKTISIDSTKKASENIQIIIDLINKIHNSGYSWDVAKSAVAEGLSGILLYNTEIKNGVGEVSSAYEYDNVIKSYAGQMVQVNLASNTVQPGQQGNDFRIFDGVIKPALEIYPLTEDDKYDIVFEKLLQVIDSLNKKQQDGMKYLRNLKNSGLTLVALAFKSVVLNNELGLGTTIGNLWDSYLNDIAAGGSKKEAALKEIANFLGVEKISDDLNYKYIPKKTIVEYEAVDLGPKTYYKDKEYKFDGINYKIVRITQNEMVLQKVSNSSEYKIIKLNHPA